MTSFAIESGTEWPPGVQPPEGLPTAPIRAVVDVTEDTTRRRSGRRPVPPMVRFEAKYVVDGKTNCWLWTAGLDKDGYGKFSPVQSWARAHRWRWEQEYGPVPDGLVLDHVVCDTRRCVNPSHLRPTTSAANTLRSATSAAAINARKTHCIHGHPLSGENLGRDRKYGFRYCRTCRNGGRLPKPKTPKPSTACAWCSQPFWPKEPRIKCCSVSCAQRRRYAAAPTLCAICSTPVKSRRSTYCSRSCANRARYTRDAA